MKFVTFELEGRARPGLWLDDGILDIEQVVPAADRILFASVLSIVANNDKTIGILKQVLDSGNSLKGALIDASRCRLLAPIPRPAKNVFCVGRNYVEHVAEGYSARGLELKLPEYPQFFTKPPTAVVGPDAEIPFQPDVMEKLDYEVELAVIIGKTGRNIAPRDALDHIFGYSIINDLTARDLQRRHDQWFKGKGLDSSCPFGPWIVHREEISDPQKLTIRLSVNGEIRQEATTAQMIFDLPRIIADLSRGMTLEAGDIIATGTPSGVGYARQPPSFLVPGDVVQCEIGGIGVLTNRIAASRMS
ncbi:fumarylacetoacetate hydrolase family protein [Bradyrhizobium sp. SYSU BS000235]|uniref:fumarylacetoacetate hydrolase family protein n=1 Tax=Bradyrhizobium sp. SYSU BS000235 TaxID=3411332 RepID=UPI003C795210